MIRNKRGKIAAFEIFNLVIALFAFSFLIGLNVERVNAAQSTIATAVGGTTTSAVGSFQDSQIIKITPEAAGSLSGSGIWAKAGESYTFTQKVVGGTSTYTLQGVELTPTQTASFAKATGTSISQSASFAAQQTLASSQSTLGNVLAGGAGQNIGGLTVQSVTQSADGTISAVFKDVAGNTIPLSGKEGATLSEIAKTANAKPVPGILNTIMADSLLGSLVWAGGIAAAVYFISGMLGVSSNNQKALAVATFAGVMTYKVLGQYLTGSGLNIFGHTEIGANAAWKAAGGAFGPSTQFLSLGIAVGVGLLILNAMWKKESKELVSFQCIPYEAPTGGQYCELCNKDKFRPCSEYRCKSLGQACELLNAGTENEMCAWVNRNDVTSPTIMPWEEVLTNNHKYKDVKTRPPGTGMRIANTQASDECIKAFTPLTFGISTNEPSQCKIDYNHTTTIRDVKKAYDSMQYYFGESSLYAYNHSQTLRLPGPTTINSSGGVEILNDGTFTLYVRCQDANGIISGSNGNVNEDEFAIRFCVEKGPDTTPPRIEGTSIPNGYPVLYGLNETFIEVYVNEPADCKWSKQDRDYEQMENTMVCNRNVFDMNSNMIYKCTTILTGLENRKDNEFYFKCKDQPNLELTDKKNDRITNQESYKFTLKGTQPINIVSVKPNGTIQGYANVVGVDLEVETSNGYNKGDSICYYSQTSDDSSYIKMFETGTNKHKQNQQLPPGSYTYYFKCVDLGGNTDYNQTSFSVEVDRSPPQVVRVYNEGNNLKIITDEKSSCWYSQIENQKCNFEISKGKQMLYSNSSEHYAEWNSNINYYIKCTDISGNQPNPIDCSIIVRPYTSLGK